MTLARAHGPETIQREGNRVSHTPLGPLGLGRWLPLATRTHCTRPAAGDLVATEHAVWRIVEVRDLPIIDDADRETWTRYGMPDPETWTQRPYEVAADWVAGAPPRWDRPGRRRRGVIRVPAAALAVWKVYPGGRWPQCSCCGEPMPCRAELADRQVARSLDKMARMEAIPPGACWACGEPITKRQGAVTYPGDNLLLPGGPPGSFHTRRACVEKAEDYEEKWLAVDPRRERILTWPRCAGTLVVHADGSSECKSLGKSLDGRASQPDCRGHSTHDHGDMTTCYSATKEPCPLGCDPYSHGGLRGVADRPKRRQPTVGGLFNAAQER